MNRYIFMGIVWVLLSACSASRTTTPGVEPVSVAASRAAGYAFAPTAGTGVDFRWAQLSPQGAFDWGALHVRFDNKTFFEGNQLVFIIEAEVTNQGGRNFPWGDHSLYVALPDAERNWNYRMLFTHSKVKEIRPNQTVRQRYYTQIPGGNLPEEYVIALQSFFGGADVGFPFVMRAKSTASR